MIKVSQSKFAQNILNEVGICLSCEEIGDPCNPEAEGKECSKCGDKQVMGLELALIYGIIEIE